MEQISIYNTRKIAGLAEILATIDCEIDPDARFLVVVINEEVSSDEGLAEAMLAAKSSGATIIVMWPPSGEGAKLPDTLLQLRDALIRFDAQALHDVICKQEHRHEGPGGGQYKAPKTDRHCC